MKRIRPVISAVFFMAFLAGTLKATDFHVSKSGDDGNTGSEAKPFITISKAAAVAQPGDTITVHEGVYRERVNPPRGGASEAKRIIYQAAPGEKVVIKGSEIVKGWKKVAHDTWKVTLPNNLFGEFNPFDDLISGDWFKRMDRDHHTGAVYLGDLWLPEAERKEDVLKPIKGKTAWFAEVSDTETTIWAQFKDFNPNKEDVEVNMRQTVFYPEQPGINYITVRGFIMQRAASPWAPPTAEQIGLIGTNWSKGWIIENNTIRDSACVGITLGKYGDEFDNKSEDSAEGYVETIERALQKGWTGETIGHYIVRSNRISHCGQAGIVGSLGAIFTTITHNDIHDIHQNQTFSGYEIAGVKFHGAIDTIISDNHIYRCGGRGGVWLDWMTQGTHLTRNLLHDNHLQDLHVEVNHGPFLVDNNIFLSQKAIWECSEGGAYVHNLIAGAIVFRAEQRKTPYFTPHTTADMKIDDFKNGDERFHNNLFIGFRGLSIYDGLKGVDIQAAGNVYLGDAKPSTYDRDALVVDDFDPEIKLQERSDGWWLELRVDPSWVSKAKRSVVTTEVLGRAKTPDALFEHPDGTPYRLDTDFFGDKRSVDNPAPGPFHFESERKLSFNVWPKAASTRNQTVTK